MLDNYIRNLRDNENKLILEVMAFISYNPSIGRVFSKGGVIKFERLMIKLVAELPTINSKETFDKLHTKYIKRLIANIKTSSKSNSSRATYGQAQKPINVFLKLYIDWAKYPNRRVRKKILGYLHVPLDKIIMTSINKEYHDWYVEKIKPKIKSPNQRYSLSKINRKLYYEWQNFFREKYSSKPLIFDLAWALNRKLSNNQRNI